MATVYLAQDLKHDRKVAIKVLRPELAAVTGAERDGRRIYYRSGAALMAATIATSPTLAVTTREKLFEGPFTTDPYHPNYDVARDGKSFIMLRPVEENRQLVMVVNWIQELRRRTGGER